MLTGVTAIATIALLPGTASATAVTVEPDRYRIVSALTGQCLALGSGVAELADCGGDATVWDIVPAPGEPALEEPVPEPEEPAPAPGRLAADDGEPMVIRNVLDCLGNDGEVAECGSGQQSWTFRSTEAGDVTILAADGKALAVVPAADETAGDTVHTTDVTGEQGEVWLLEVVE